MPPSPLPSRRAAGVAGQGGWSGPQAKPRHGPLDAPGAAPRTLMQLAGRRPKRRPPLRPDGGPGPCSGVPHNTKRKGPGPEDARVWGASPTGCLQPRLGAGAASARPEGAGGRRASCHRRQSADSCRATQQTLTTTESDAHRGVRRSLSDGSGAVRGRLEPLSRDRPKMLQVPS